MKAKEIEVGKVYWAKVSGKLVKVKVVAILDQMTWKGYARKSYRIVNLSTRREVTFRSAQKFRWEAGKEPTATKRMREDAAAMAQAVVENVSAPAVDPALPI